MLKKLLLIFAISFFLTCCNPNHTSIPNMPVRLEFYLVSAPELNNYFGFKEFVEPQHATQYLGYGGILVFHTIDDRFCAFDMSCPYEAKPDVRVHCDITGFARCDSCQSTFYVGDGNAFLVDGKAKFPLKSYQVYYNSALGSIFVTN